MVSLINEPESFTGGELLFRRNENDSIQETVKFGKGDVVFFPSAAAHYVTTVTGYREVLCVEWWTLGRNRRNFRLTPQQYLIDAAVDDEDNSKKSRYRRQKRDL